MASALRKAMVKTPSKACGRPLQALLRKAVASVVERCLLVCAFSRQILNGEMVDFGLLSFSAMEEAGPSICVHPQLGRELQLEQFQL